MTHPLSDLSARRIDGATTSLGAYAGSALLIVNVASECGLTAQYAGLEKLYEAYRERGFAVLGFPSNQFGEQEPGTNAEIHDFCRTTYGVAFPMFAKIDVKGPRQDALYKYLTDAGLARTLTPMAMAAGKKPRPGTDVRWNFEKFVLDREGKVIARFDPDVVPEDPAVIETIEAALGR